MYTAGNFKARNEVVQLLKSAGATVLKRMPTQPDSCSSHRVQLILSDEKGEISLFNNSEICEMDKQSIDDLSQLLPDTVNVCADKPAVMSTVPSRSSSVPVITEKWLMDCISSYSVLPTGMYQIDQ